MPEQAPKEPPAVRRCREHDGEECSETSGLTYVGIGVMFFLIFLGMGSCSYIANKNANGPLISIKSER